jgi:anti-sigma28 factor (negative regulator of flagellin synthesis)
MASSPSARGRNPMQAIRKTSLLADRLRATSASRSSEAQSPEQSASATSGTYFRAVRPTAAEAAATARGEPLIDCAKIEGLRFELDVGVWRRDSERVARCVIGDAECVTDDGDGDE